MPRSKGEVGIDYGETKPTASIKPQAWKDSITKVEEAKMETKSSCKVEDMFEIEVRRVMKSKIVE